jgi:glycolate oxidase FAD binding subunit
MEGDSCGARNRRSDSVTSAIQETVRSARESRTALRIAGSSTWLAAGRPVAAANTLSVAQSSGVVEYVPSDLTITVRGGTTLADLASATRTNGQWFPVNPFGSDSGTIGATVATASSGPLSHGFGTIRDLVLGVEVVTGGAKVIRGGGRVVKNVAGFDMVRLMTGSWGTLGVITEVTLRLYALPSNRRTVAMEAPADVRRLAERLSQLLDAPILPFALELLSTEAARKVGLPPRPIILIELGGNAAAVAAQTDALRKLGPMVDAAPEMWDALRRPDWRETAVFRVSGFPSRLAERWERVGRIAVNTEAAVMHASIGRGTVRCSMLAEPTSEVANQLTELQTHDTVILENAPPFLWEKISPSATADRVSMNLRKAFDPSGILNPGILGPIN